MPKAHLEKFSWEIDEDDDISTELELKIENTDGRRLDFVVTNCLVTMTNGCIVSGSHEDREDLGDEEGLEPGDSESIDINTGWVRSVGYLRSESSLTASVGLDYYGYGDSVSLFESELPQDHETPGYVEKIASPNNVILVTGATICRSKADDDGEVMLEAKFGLRNTSAKEALKVSLDMIVVDKNGETIGEFEDQADIAPESVQMNELGAGMLKSKLKGAKVRVSYRACDLVGRERLDIESA
ncbi:MAG: hypothetical protein VCB25_03525 [Myxococcota bacterium]